MSYSSSRYASRSEMRCRRCRKPSRGRDYVCDCVNDGSYDEDGDLGGSWYLTAPDPNIPTVSIGPPIPASSAPLGNRSGVDVETEIPFESTNALGDNPVPGLPASMWWIPVLVIGIIVIVIIGIFLYMRYRQERIIRGMSQYIDGDYLVSRSDMDPFIPIQIPGFDNQVYSAL